MYQVSTSREHIPVRRQRSRSGAQDERKNRASFPPEEGGRPLSTPQLEALRQELGLQDWLDPLMSMMKAAGNDTRVRILYLLWRRGEVRVNDLATILELTTPAISQQLKKLRGCGLVMARRDAQTIYYRLNPDSDFVLCLVGFFDEEHA